MPRELSFRADLTTGTYDITQVKGVSSSSLFEGKLIIDKTNGHLTYGCVSCCGYQAVALDPTPFSNLIGYGTYNSLLAEEICNNTWDDVTYAGYSWNSSNYSVAQVANAHTQLMSIGEADGTGIVSLLWGNRTKTCPNQPHTGTAQNYALSNGCMNLVQAIDNSSPREITCPTSNASATASVTEAGNVTLMVTDRSVTKSPSLGSVGVPYWSDGGNYYGGPRQAGVGYYTNLSG